MSVIVVINGIPVTFESFAEANQRMANLDALGEAACKLMNVDPKREIFLQAGECPCGEAHEIELRRLVAYQIFANFLPATSQWLEARLAVDDQLKKHR